MGVVVLRIWPLPATVRETRRQCDRVRFARCDWNHGGDTSACRVFRDQLRDGNLTFNTDVHHGVGYEAALAGVSAIPRQLPLTFSSAPSVFLNAAEAQVASIGSVVLALNADGSINSPTNPAILRSTISVFVNGLAPDPRFINFPVQLSTTNGWSVTGIVPANPFVLRVDLVTPSALVNNFFCGTSYVCGAGFTLYDAGFVSIGQVVSGGEAFGGVVYVNRTP